MIARIAGLITAPLLAIGLASSAAVAEDAVADAHSGHAMVMKGSAALPAACIAAAGASPMEDAAPMGDMAAQSPVQTGNMDAMSAMHGSMMQAATIEDADLAFNCGMIAHHRGAIAMAKVELEHGKDEASRRLANAIIAAQETEIAEMTAWVEARAK